MSDDADPELAEATVVSANALLEALIPQLQTTPIEIVKPSRDSRVGMQLQPLGALVVVDNRADDGLAAAAGICAGDVVISINGERVTDHDQGASLVIASEGVVRLEIIRPGAAAAAEAANAAHGAAVDDGAAADGAAPPDALGSGETLGSLGVDLSAALPAPPTELLEDEPALPATLIDADGRNAYAIACRFCGTAILPKGKVVLEPERTAELPPMPRRAADAPPAEAPGCWRAADKYDFENMGVSKSPSADGLRYLICAGCDLGPFGWFYDARADETLGEKVPFYVAVGRVRYIGALD
jgi:hypothetical protein